MSGILSIVFHRIYVQPLHIIGALMIVLLVLWVVLAEKAGGRLWWKLFNGAVFGAAAAVILYMTVYARGESPQAPVLIPFYSFVEARVQPEFYRSMLMNVFLFEPIGLSLPNILPQKAHPVVLTVLFAMLLSIGIEAAQFYFSLGRCETDDVIMNTLGAAIGGLAYGRRLDGIVQCINRTVSPMCTEF